MSYYSGTWPFPICWRLRRVSIYPLRWSFSCLHLYGATQYFWQLGRNHTQCYLCMAELFFLIYPQHLQGDLTDLLIMDPLKPIIHLGSTLIRPRIHKKQAMVSWSRIPKNQPRKRKPQTWLQIPVLTKPWIKFRVLIIWIVTIRDRNLDLLHWARYVPWVLLLPSRGSLFGVLPVTRKGT